MNETMLKNGKLIISIFKEFDITKAVYLEGINITSLPEGLSVGGSLYLGGTNITSLPEGLSVGGSLYLEGINITKKNIPNHLIKKCIGIK